MTFKVHSKQLIGKIKICFNTVLLNDFISDARFFFLENKKRIKYIFIDFSITMSFNHLVTFHKMSIWSTFKNFYRFTKHIKYDYFSEFTCTAWETAVPGLKTVPGLK